MRKVQSLAAQSNLTIRTFTPGATVNKEFYQEWPINMAVDGSYHNLGYFFDRVSRLSRLVNVGNLKITLAPEPDRRPARSPPPAWPPPSSTWTRRRRRQAAPGAPGRQVRR